MNAKRYIVMTIPARDDRDVSTYHVYDLQAHRSVMRCDDFDAARECAKLANHANK